MIFFRNTIFSLSSDPINFFSIEPGKQANKAQHNNKISLEISTEVFINWKQIKSCIYIYVFGRSVRRLGEAENWMPGEKEQTI